MTCRTHQQLVLAEWAEHLNNVDVLVDHRAVSCCVSCRFASTNSSGLEQASDTMGRQQCPRGFLGVETMSGSATKQMCTTQKVNACLSVPTCVAQHVFICLTCTQTIKLYARVRKHCATIEFYNWSALAACHANSRPGCRHSTGPQGKTWTGARKWTSASRI